MSMDMQDKIAVLTAKLAMANDENERLSKQSRQLWAFVEEVERNSPTGDQQPVETWKWAMWVIGNKARALLTSLRDNDGDTP